MENGLLKLRRFINANRGVIYGMLLGDGYISDRGRSSFFGVNHSEGQREYLFYKYGLLREFCASPPVFYRDRRGDRFGSWSMKTFASAEWQRLWSIFHQDSKATVRYGRRFTPKVVTSQILDGLDDRGVAFWIMDDGYLAKWRMYKAVNAQFRLATCEFGIAQNQMILEWFKERYGAEGFIWMNQKRSSEGEVQRYPYVAFGRRAYEKIVARVARHIHPSMNYKIDFNIPAQVQGSLSASGR